MSGPAPGSPTTTGASDGELLAAVERGEALQVPLWAEQRLLELGRDPAEWRSRFSD